jgi:hypothetical protein
MAVHLKKILGDLLYLEEPDETKDHLPSPEDLRNKVTNFFPLYFNVMSSIIRSHSIEKEYFIPINFDKLRSNF